ncbi:MAG: hypothetical protein LUE86_00985 [Clostridiales bacterium]|nr:hypothetical protein [Clostridiales bacterium]
MKKLLGVFVGTAVVVSMSMTAFAGQWVSDGNGWWYANDDGTWPASTWEWIDGNGDGIAECYYFLDSGYMATGTAPGGDQLNEDGALTIEGVVQTRQMTYSAEETDSTYQADDEQIVIFHWSTMTVEILGYSEEGWYDLTHDLYWVEENTLARKDNVNPIGQSLGWTDFSFCDDDTVEVVTYSSDGSHSGSFLDGTFNKINNR